MVLQKMRVSQKLSQIPGVLSSRILVEGLLRVSISFSMLRKSRACRKCISLTVSQSLAFTIRHPYSYANHSFTHIFLSQSRQNLPTKPIKLVVSYRDPSIGNIKLMPVRHLLNLTHTGHRTQQRFTIKHV